MIFYTEARSGLAGLAGLVGPVGLASVGLSFMATPVVSNAGESARIYQVFTRYLPGIYQKKITMFLFFDRKNHCLPGIYQVSNGNIYHFLR